MNFVNYPKRTPIQKYDRHSTISLEEGFKYIANSQAYAKVEINGVMVKVGSMRLRSFLQNGTKCAYEGCPYEASYFAIERDLEGKTNYHLNLWGKTHDDKDVLFTHDHILARGLGGLDTLSNTQTMCCWHNWAKGDAEGRIVQQNWVKSRPEFHGNALSFTYVTAAGERKVLRNTTLIRKTFNFYLNDPGTWITEQFVDLVWKHAGFSCSEVRLVNNDFVHPELNKLAHRYDLYFVTGRGLPLENNKAVNELMRRIEADIRANLNITMEDTHDAEKRHIYLTSSPVMC